MGPLPRVRAGIYLITGTGNQLMDSNATSTIPAGGADTNESDSFTIPNLAPGLYAVSIFADDERVLTESDENNNIYSIYFNVAATVDTVREGLDTDELAHVGSDPERTDRSGAHGGRYRIAG